MPFCRVILNIGFNYFLDLQPRLRPHVTSKTDWTYNSLDTHKTKRAHKKHGIVKTKSQI